MLPNCVPPRSRPLTFARAALLIAGCAVVFPAGAQPKADGGRSTGQTVVTYRGETLTRAELNQMVAAQRQALKGAGQIPPDLDLMVVYGWLREEALYAVADEMKIQPDPRQVRQQEQELRKQLTPENWKKLQAGGQFTLQAVERYREGLRQGAKNEAQLRNAIWKELGGERNAAGVPRAAFDQTLSAVGRDDQAYQELKASIPTSPDDAVAKAREEFSDISRLMQVQDRIAGKVEVTEDEMARARQVIPTAEQRQMAQAPGGFKGALTALKKQQKVDEWLRPRILSQARFADKNLERRFRAMLTQGAADPSGARPQGQAQRPPSRR